MSYIRVRGSRTRKMGGRKAGEGFKVKVTCSIPIEIAEFLRDRNHSPTDILVGAARKLLQEDEEEQAKQAAREYTKNDLGPHSLEETRSYLDWCDTHPDSKPKPYEEKFKLWREEVGDLVPKASGS